MSEKTTGLELLEPASPEALLPQIGLWPWFAGAAVLAILVLVLCLVLRKRKLRFDPVTARNAAYQEAAADLQTATAADTRDAAVRSSLVLRRYLSAAAGDPALFETHEEFVSRHDALNALTPEARAAAGEGFTRLASLKYGPELPEIAPTEVIGESRKLLETLHQGFAA